MVDDLEGALAAHQEEAIMDMRLACKCPGDDSGAEAGHQEGEAKPLNLVISSRLR